MKRFISAVLAAVLAACWLMPIQGNAASSADKPVKLNLGVMEIFAAFVPWYAHEKGWDKEAGLDLNLISFNSGPAQMEALPSKTWDIALTGIGGLLIGGMRYDLYEITPANDSGKVDSIYIRADHPAAQIKGWNPEFPDVYGSPETIKGANILLPTITNAHILLTHWLAIFGLTEADIKLTNMEQTSIVPAMSKGIGDMAGAWTPVTDALKEMGMVQAATLTACHQLAITEYVAPKAWADAHPELIVKFLNLTYDTVDKILAENQSEYILKEYQRYSNDFCGLKMDLEQARYHLANYNLLTYEQCLAIVDMSKGESRSMESLRAAAELFTAKGKYTQAEYDRLMTNGFMTDKFVKMARQPA